jgi:hypothetical protein
MNHIIVLVEIGKNNYIFYEIYRKIKIIQT